MQRISVIKDDCTACGLCAETTPGYFRIDEHDLAESHNGGANVNNAVVAAEDCAMVQVAIDDCPGECIHWRPVSRRSSVLRTNQAAGERPRTAPN